MIPLNKTCSISSFIKDNERIMVYFLLSLIKNMLGHLSKTKARVKLREM